MLQVLARNVPCYIYYILPFAIISLIQIYWTAKISIIIEVSLGIDQLLQKKSREMNYLDQSHLEEAFFEMHNLSHAKIVIKCIHIHVSYKHYNTMQQFVFTYFKVNVRQFLGAYKHAHELTCIVATCCSHPPVSHTTHTGNSMSY